MEKRTDWEVARWNAGYEILDGIEGEGGEEGWRRETREGRWSENGWCEVPLGLEVRLPFFSPSPFLLFFRSALQSHDGGWTEKRWERKKGDRRDRSRVNAC